MVRYCILLYLMVLKNFIVLNKTLKNIKFVSNGIELFCIVSDGDIV